MQKRPDPDARDPPQPNTSEDVAGFADGKTVPRDEGKRFALVPGVGLLAAFERLKKKGLQPALRPEGVHQHPARNARGNPHRHVKKRRFGPQEPPEQHDRHFVDDGRRNEKRHRDPERNPAHRETDEERHARARAKGRHRPEERSRAVADQAVFAREKGPHPLDLETRPTKGKHVHHENEQKEDFHRVVEEEVERFARTRLGRETEKGEGHPRGQGFVCPIERAPEQKHDGGQEKNSARLAPEHGFGHGVSVIFVTSR